MHSVCIQVGLHLAADAPRSNVVYHGPQIIQKYPLIWLVSVAHGADKRSILDKELSVIWNLDKLMFTAESFAFVE